MNSNPICVVCDEIATRVCIHPQCTINPFFCSGKCKHNQSLATSLHTHNGKTKFIPLKQLLNRTKQIKEKISIQKFVSYSTKQIKAQIENLKDLLNRYQEMFKGKELKLKKEIAATYNNLVTGERSKKLTGKHIFELASLNEVLDKESYQFSMIDKAQHEIGKVISKLEDIKIGSKLNPEKAEIHWQEGHKLYILMRFPEALKEFKLAAKMNPFDDRYLKEMQQCMNNCNKSIHAQIPTSKSIPVTPVNTVIPSIPIPISVSASVRVLPSVSATTPALISKASSNSLSSDSNLQPPVLESTVSAPPVPSLYQISKNADFKLFNLGKDALHEKKFYEAIEHFTKAIKQNPNDSKYFQHRAEAWKNINNLTQALEDYNRAIKLNPKDESIYNDRGSLHYLAKNYPRAIKDFDKAIQLDNKASWYYANRGSAYERLKYHKQALEDYSQSIEVDKDCYKNYERRAELYMKNEDYQLAIDDYTRSLEIVKTSFCFKRRSEAYNKIGQFQKASKDEYEASRC